MGNTFGDGVLTTIAAILLFFGGLAFGFHLGQKDVMEDACDRHAAEYIVHDGQIEFRWKKAIP